MPPSTLAVNGYWGESTSTLDWCERNYEVTIYIAEFWNSVSNLAMIVPPLWAYAKWYEAIDGRNALCLTFLTLVGFGSFSFHATLLWEMQLFDELPMLWGSLILIYCLLTLLYPFIERSRYGKGITIACLFLYGTVATFVYLGFKTPLFFQIAYGFLVTCMLYLDICVAKYKPCDVRVFYASAILYYTGFLLWNIDNIFCDYLDQLRQFIPYMLAPLTQFHALWHCLAGYGAYLHILFCAHSRALTLKQDVRFAVDWTGVSIKCINDQINYKKKQL